VIGVERERGGAVEVGVRRPDGTQVEWASTVGCGCSRSSMRISTTNEPVATAALKS
jgi:hypothetical protein